MNYGIRLLALLTSFILLFSLASAATIGGPTMGLWYNPLESGRGYDIELQDDSMIVTTYIYQADGSPIWYLSSGPYDHATGYFQSTYDSYSNGQCFGCPYQAPVVDSGAGGPITISFVTNQTAILTYPGGSTPIVKYVYGFPTRTDVLYGEWAFSYENQGTIAGDWIVFNAPYTDPAGNVYASGYAVGAPTTTALGIYDSTALEAQITVTQGTTQRHYRFGVFDDRRVIGVATVDTTGQPEAGPFTATGARLLYLSELANIVIGSDAGQTKSAVTSAGASGDGQDAAARLRRAAAEFAASKR